MAVVPRTPLSGSGRCCAWNNTGLCRPISTPNSSVDDRSTSRDHDLDHDLGRLGVQLLRRMILAKYCGRGTDEQFVGERLGDDDDVRSDLLDRRSHWLVPE